MDDNILHIFTSTKCLSEDILIKYIKNELSPDERHAAEIHLTDCEICQDLVEGLSEFNNYEKLPVVVEELNSRVDAILNRKPKIIQLDFYKMFTLVASILLLVVLTYFVMLYYINYQNYVTKFAKIETIDDAIIINTSKTTRNNELIVVVSRPKLTPEEKQNLAQLKNLESDYYRNEIIADNIQNENFIAENITEGTKSLTGETNSENLVLHDEVANNEEEKQIKDKSKDFSFAEETESEDIINSNVASKKAESRDAVEAGLNEIYENKSEAKLDFDNMVVSANDTLIFYSGLSNYQLNNYIDAIKSFEIIIENKNSKFYEAAVYYKALSFINLDKKKTAQKLLEEVIELNGEYFEQAKQKLEEIK